MAPEPITRRHALGAGAAVVAAGALSPSVALARRPALFELDLDGVVAGGSAGWSTTTVIRAPRRFDLIGLGWAAGSAGVEAQVRARRDRGPWSRWVALHAAGDHAPDGSRGPRPQTEPAWTDSADVFQLRLRGSATGLRARFVRAKPTASLAGVVTRRLHRRAAARASQAPPPPGGQLQPPPIISRGEWGADSVPPRADPAYGDVQVGFVHHTVTANDYQPEDSAAIVLGIARYHRDSNGWNDIGYNFLVDKYGQVFEGRAGGIELAVIGAQAQGYNAHSTGVACLGTLETVPWSEPGLTALAKLLAWKLSLHGVPAQGTVTVASNGGESNRYRSGTPVTLHRISGHRDGDSTSCPGDRLYGQLPRIRDEVARRIGEATTSVLTLRAASSRVRYPTPVRLSGTLRFADGSSADGVPLTLEYEPPDGGAAQAAGSATCGSDGSWAAAVELAADGRLRARFPGDGARSPVDSAPVAVSVLPRLTMKLASRRVRRGGAIRVTGTLAPAAPGIRVECALQRQVGSRWLTVSKRHPVVTDAAYATLLRSRVPGLYRVLVLTDGASEHAAVRVTTS